LSHGEHPMLLPQRFGLPAYHIFSDQGQSVALQIHLTSSIIHFLASTLHDSLTTALYTEVCARLCAPHASTFPSLSRHFASTPAPVLRARQLCGSARQPYTSTSQLYSSQNAQRFDPNGERFSENGHRFLLPTADTALATAHP